MSKILKENDRLESSDLALCVTLCCYGYQIESINRQGPKAIFEIKMDEKLDGLIKKYWAHQLKVDPLSFFNFLKEIKTRIYNL
jgi:hypothetical protein